MSFPLLLIYDFTNLLIMYESLRSVKSMKFMEQICDVKHFIKNWTPSHHFSLLLSSSLNKY